MNIYTHQRCLDHDTGAGHPEHAGRLAAILDALRTEFADALTWCEAPLGDEAQVGRAHVPAFIDLLKRNAPAHGLIRVDADTVMSPASLEASYRASGALCAAVDAAVLRNERGFCAVRPPGHHSTGNEAMGFCLFNHVAVAAHHALAAHGCARISIVDFDVHHGNGTQDIFENEPRVQFVSSHQSPLYPGTGRASERGVGNIVNGELRPGSGSDAFCALWSSTLLPAVDAFAPELIIISAGFDAHRLDPLADLNLDAADFAWITTELVRLAERHAHGRIVSTLEGGYSLAALRESSVAHVRAMMRCHRLPD